MVRPVTRVRLTTKVPFLEGCQNQRVVKTTYAVTPDNRLVQRAAQEYDWWQCIAGLGGESLIGIVSTIGADMDRSRCITYKLGSGFVLIV